MIALPLLSNRSFARFARIAAVPNGGNDDPARIEVEPRPLRERSACRALALRVLRQVFRIERVLTGDLSRVWPPRVVPDRRSQIWMMSKETFAGGCVRCRTKCALRWGGLPCDPQSLRCL